MKYRVYILSILIISLTILLTSCSQGETPNSLDNEAVTSPPILRGERGNKSVVLYWNWLELDFQDLKQNYSTPETFDVLISENESAEWNVIDQVNINQAIYPVEGLENNKIYYFAILATSESGQSSISNKIMIMPSAGESVNSIFSPGQFDRFWGSYSPDGQYITYESNMPSGNSAPLDTLNGIYTYHLANGTEQFITKGSMPDWSSIDNKIAFHRQANTTNTQLYIYDLNNEALQIVGSPAGFNHQISWANNSANLIFLSDVSNNNLYQIYKMSYQAGLNNSADLLYSPSMSNQNPDNIDFLSPLTPQWLPNDEGVIFSELQESATYSRRQVYSRSFDENINQAFFSSEWNDQSPVFSPNGEFLAFISDRSGDKSIWLYHIQTAVFRQLISFSRVDSRASQIGDKLSWSPDGTQILFTAPFENTNHLGLFTVNIF